MNMNTTSSTSSPEATMTMMIPWLHFAGGDNLLFKSLHPSSRGAIAAACIVLIAIAVFERWVAAMRGSLEAHWRHRHASAYQTCIYT
jgi:solute carrier family 31 (copper transporter), member 1